MATKFCAVAPNICGSSVWNLLYVTLLSPKILRWLLDFWKIHVPLAYGMEGGTNCSAWTFKGYVSNNHEMLYMLQLHKHVLFDGPYVYSLLYCLASLFLPSILWTVAVSCLCSFIFIV
jgi:hypothetical protein